MHAGSKLKRNTFVWSTGGMLIAGLDSQGLTLSFTLCAPHLPVPRDDLLQSRGVGHAQACE